MRTAITDLPGLNPLVADYFSHFDKVAEFYNGDYRKPENFLHRAGKIKSRNLPLAQLTPILKEQNQQFGCGQDTLEHLQWLAESKACAVVTGQQTGLFSGPLFTIYKALTAIKLAARLNRICEGCYVPVFWLASDDHDFREVDHINIIDKDNQLRRLQYQGHDRDSKLPVARITLDETIHEIIAEVDDATHPSEFKQQVLDLLAEAYSPGVSFSQAFGKWLMTLFKSFGLIFIDASDVRIKGLAKDLFRREIVERSPSTAAALAASQQLESSGYHAQVQVQEGLLNLFYSETERHSLVFENGHFSVKNSDLAFAEKELLQRLESNPDYFSPNVLLRPLYQDTLLPTIAYIAGPGESSYYAQMKGIYEHFDIPMPVIYPRKSLTLLEPRIEKVLDRYALHVRDFWGNVDQLITSIARAQLPENLETQIAEAAASVQEKFAELESTVAEFDPTLVDFIKNTGARLQGQIEGLEKKVLQSYKKRNDVISQQITKAQNSLYPNNHLQERELNILPYLFKYGLGFMDQLYEATDISNFDHQIVRI